jgi:anaerobic selenocysteine-containing dehydrogenase
MEAYPVMHESLAARPDLMPRPSRSLDVARFGDHLTDVTLHPPIKGVMIWGTNPAVVQPNCGKVRQGLAREDVFTVVLEHFVTDTARYADIVLPATTQLEHFDVQGAWGHHYILVNNPAIPPVGEAKTHGEVMRLLAQGLGLTHPALRESDEEIAAAVLPTGIDLATLRAQGWHKSSPGRPTFASVRGTLSLSAQVPQPATAPAPGMLQLLTPKAHYFLNSSFGNMPRQRRAMKRPTLDMHPADAQARGLVDGQQVVVKNRQGAVTAWLRVTDDMHRGVVSLPGKWWSVPEETGTVANVLTPSSWSVGGQPAYNDTFVEVVNAS